MMSLPQRAKDLIKQIERLKFARRKVAILCGRPLSGKTTLAKEVNQHLGTTYIDVSVDLLPKITSPVLGAYGPDDFLDWVKSEANRGTTLFVDEIEPLLATFGERETQNFFQKLSSIEPKQSVVVVTRLVELVKQAGFPDDRIFRLL